MSASWARGRSAASALLRCAASSSTSSSRAFAAVGSPAATASAAAAPALDKFRERLAAGPDFSAFISGEALASKDGYSVVAPPLKARSATRAARAWSQRVCSTARVQPPAVAPLNPGPALRLRTHRARTRTHAGPAAQA